MANFFGSHGQKTANSCLLLLWPRESLSVLPRLFFMHTLPDITTCHLPPAGHPARDTPPNLDAGQPHRPTQPAICEAIIFLTYFNYAENIICRYVAAQGRWRGAAGLPAGAAGPAGQGSRRQPREVQILEKLRKFRYIRRRTHPRSVRTSYLF